MQGGVAAVILAAGESRRMGRPKALLDWGGKALLQHQLDELSAAGCDPLVVVLGHEALTIEAAIDCRGPCQIVVNSQYRTGRASSLRAGAASLPDATGAVIVASVDGPCSTATVRALIDAWRAGPRRGAPPPGSIIVPRYESRNGHPALFDGSLLAEMRAVEERSEGLRALRRAHVASTTFLDVDDPLVTLNLNTPEDYAAARARRDPGDPD